MRSSCPALLPSSNLFASKLSALNFSALILCILIGSTVAFAAAPDRITGTINSGPTIALAKSHHPKAQPQYDRGPVDPSFKLSYMTLLMAPSAAQQAELNQLSADQQDRQSPLFHKWLTPAQYADRFGLSQNDLTKIANWLTSEGFQIISIGSGHNTVIFSGTAGQAQHAFGTEIHNYEVDGVKHIANSTPLMVPAALEGIVTGVMGLHNFLPKPAIRGKRLGAMRNARPAYYDGNYIWPNYLAPGDIATIYDITKLYNLEINGKYIDGTGQTLAIVGQTDVYLDDLNDFRSGFGLSTLNCTADPTTNIITACSDPHFLYVLNGSDPGFVDSEGDDLGEADLDLEWSGAVAYNAQIVYVNSPNTASGVYDSLLAAINYPGPPLANVISMSYGYCEIGAPDLEVYLLEANTLGVTVINSAADEGSAACDYDPPTNSQNYPNPPYLGAEYGLAVSYPASSQYVTGVGGTEITLANDSYPTQSSYWNTPTTNPLNGGTATGYIPEIPWNDDEEFANYCHEPYKTDTFCSTGNGTTDWVALSTTATAAQVQADIWISIGGGGASNCAYTKEVNGSPVCLGSGAGPSGGGLAQPSYQNFSPPIAGAPAGVRYVPDVSMMASPNFPGYIWCTAQSELGEGGSASTCVNGIFDAVDTYQSQVGGTSASAPVFAGIVTLLNQYLGGTGLGNVNPTLYQLAAGSYTSGSAPFNHVTTGDNMVYCQTGLPSGFPSNVVCPAAGVFGFEASKSDSKTGYNLVTGLGSVDAYNLAFAWAAARPASTITVGASPTSVVLGQTVALTATVSGTTSPSTPTGTVSFLDNTSTTLGTAALTSTSAGVGTFTWTPTLAQVGTNVITASYAGDGYNAASSTTTSVTVDVTAPTFTVSTPTTPGTVHSGESTNPASTFTVTPGGGATTFAANVTFACSGLPDTTVTCSFNTGQVNNPTYIAAGSGPTQVILTIATTGPNTVQTGIRQRRADKRSPWLPLALPLAGIVMAGFAGRKISKHSAAAGLCASLLLLGLLVACGGSSSPPIIVSVSPSAVTVYPYDAADNWPIAKSQAAFSATVINTNDSLVNWTVTSGPGSISSAGVYLAPTIAARLATTATVTATSQTDTTKVGTAVVNITPTTVPNSYSVTVTATESTTVETQGVTLVVQ